jgi:hypothetical protein
VICLISKKKKLETLFAFLGVFVAILQLEDSVEQWIVFMWRLNAVAVMSVSCRVGAALFSIRSADRCGCWAGAAVRVVRMIMGTVPFPRPSSFPFLEAWRAGYIGLALKVG